MDKPKRERSTTSVPSMTAVMSVMPINVLTLASANCMERTGSSRWIGKVSSCHPIQSNTKMNNAGYASIANAK